METLFKTAKDLRLFFNSVTVNIIFYGHNVLVPETSRLRL